jgi:DNA-binding MarR family transcriptional regulator
VLSVKGSEIMALFKKVESQVFNRMIKNISDEEIKQFVELSAQLKQNLE